MTQKTTTAASAMKIPMCRPWSSGSPQNTGSCAPGDDVVGDRDDGWASFCSGPPSANR